MKENEITMIISHEKAGQLFNDFEELIFKPEFYNSNASEMEEYIEQYYPEFNEQMGGYKRQGIKRMMKILESISFGSFVETAMGANRIDCITAQEILKRGKEEINIPNSPYGMFMRGIMTAQKQAELFYLRNMAALSASKNFNATEYMLRLINPERYGEKTKVKNNGQIKVSLSINGLTKNGE